jgi:enhancer of mRNA-decapping protein 4
VKQNIILSLIQQLSVDLKTKADTKFHFLQDSILALDLRRPSAEHIPNVLSQLQGKIAQFIETWPRDPMAKNYRMIAMTAAGMLKQN